MKIGIYLNDNPLFPIFSKNEINLSRPGFAILDIFLSEFLKRNDEIIFLNQYYKREKNFRISEQLKHIKTLSFDKDIKNEIDKFDNSFKYIHKNKEKFLNCKINYSTPLNYFDAIIIEPRFAFMHEFYTIKLLYDCVINKIPVYIIDLDLYVEKFLDKWIKDDSIRKKITILSTIYSEKENFLHISYGYRKELEKDFQEQTLNDIAFVGASQTSFSKKHSRISLVKEWFSKLNHHKISLYGNWNNTEVDNINKFDNYVSFQENLNILNKSKSTIHFYLQHYLNNNAIVVGNRIYDAAIAATCLFLLNEKCLPPYLSDFKQLIVKTPDELDKKLKTMSKFEREQQVQFQRKILEKYTPEYEFNKFLKYHNYIN